MLKTMEHFIDVGVAQNRMPNYQEVKKCSVNSFFVCKIQRMCFGAGKGRGGDER